MASVGAGVSGAADDAGFSVTVGCAGGFNRGSAFADKTAGLVRPQLRVNTALGQELLV